LIDSFIIPVVRSFIRPPLDQTDRALVSVRVPVSVPATSQAAERQRV